MCPACARTPEGCAAEGCGAAGRRAPRPVRVVADAVERQAESFVARRSVLDQPAAEPVAGSVPLFEDDDWDDGPGLDWSEGPDEPPPSRRVATIETTGDVL